MAFRNLRFDPAAPMVVGRRGLFVNGVALAPGATLPGFVDQRRRRTLYESGRIVGVPAPAVAMAEKSAAKLPVKPPMEVKKSSKPEA